MPLREILERADWNEALAQAWVSEAVRALETKRLTISGPRSILRTVRNLAGKTRLQGTRADRVRAESTIDPEA